ncbi:bifunctional hydroxymethylpyrimidine kinase/phosphomethylpyrimidine kinase [Paenibacillus senegalensis]|uniref:bifunctional hydroxymethylpyrimidine kinase/phosphomethylpyrimidine kinase n=1 Tax=Paenibacillus senegalensis TaxID=1465766 RepID=UPI000289BE97|nr:bifunctional hydroxymethylpyrimidine kinase/phosphomethylpyrimidine kinase [Paenibacillus senegalensis]
MSFIPKALTIAGSDSGGGAGIQADLKTFQMLEVYGMSVITAITAQNTLGVHGVYDVSLEGINQQMDAVMTDLTPDAVKTGMLSKPEVIDLIADKVSHYKIEKLVVDPVMVAKGGASLLAQEAIMALRSKLLPLAAVVTPNLPETEVLTGREVASLEQMKDAAKYLVEVIGVRSAVVKGGHASGPPTDVFFDGSECHLLPGERLETRHTHGTGCTFSSVIASGLAKGMSMHESVRLAKQFITLAIQEELGLGSGHGPTNHWAYSKQMSRA